MKRILFTGLSALALGACVSVLPQQIVPEGLYRLTSTSTLPESGQDLMLPVSVTVFEPEGSSLLLSRNIVYESKQGALSVLPNAQWSDPVGRLLQTLLLDRLAALKQGEDTRVVSDRTGALTLVDLKWQVTDFVIQEGEARVSVRVTLLGARSRRIVGQFDVSEAVSFTGKPQEAGIPALQTAAAKAVDKIALTLPDRLDQTALEAVSRRR